MLQNYNYKDSNDNSSIKYVCSTIKWIGFEPIHYAVNIYVVSSSMIFSDFDFVFISIYC